MRQRVRDAVRQFGALLAAKAVLSFARPKGGGLPVAIRPEHWELDNWRMRFATSAIAPDRPFDESAARTHWIFLDLDGFNDLVEASVADVVPRSAVRRTVGGRKPNLAAPADLELGRIEAGAALDRHIRLPELLHLTGMSRSILYSRIKEGRFPRSEEQEGTMASWRESRIAEWLANPR